MTKTMNIEEINLENDTEYRQSVEKLETLKSSLREFQRQEAELLAEVRIINSRSPEHAVTTLDRQADALLNGKDFTASVDLETLSQKINELRSQMTVHKRAIERQSATVQGHRGRVSFEICKKLLPRHKENVRGVVRALLNLSEAMTVERKLRFDLEARGVSNVGLTVMSDPVRLGRAGDVTSRLRMFLNESLGHGFITPTEFEKLISTEGGNI